MQPIRVQLSKNQKSFCNFFVRFWNIDQILNNWKEKMTLTADVFSKIRTKKDVIR